MPKLIPMTADEALIVLVLEAKEKTKVFDGPDPLFLQVSCEAEKIFGKSATNGMLLERWMIGPL